MRVLYAIQGTGNGHIARAQEIIPALVRRVSLDLLVSGMHSELVLPYPVKYQFQGLGFKFGKKGGVDYFNTWWRGDVPGFMKEVQQLDLSSYDLVINDFEPISAWAARKQHIPCVGLSNQGTLHIEEIINRVTQKRRYRFARSILKYYAPVDFHYGFHYNPINENIFSPIIREDVRDLQVSNEGHYAVYLPFYNDKKIVKFLSYFRGQKWIVFSKHSKKYYRNRNIDILPITNTRFLEELATASGVICGAGFGLTSEALFLGKKLLVIPMKNQFEQYANALALNDLGIDTVKSLNFKWRKKIEQWIERDQAVQIHYPNQTQEIIDKILADYAKQVATYHDGIHNYDLRDQKQD